MYLYPVSMFDQIGENSYVIFRKWYTHCMKTAIRHTQSTC